MSTLAPEWDIPGTGTLPPAGTPQGDVQPGNLDDETRNVPAREQTANPIRHWWQEMRGDIAARKARSDGRWWAMRWMNEQPTSVADYLDHYLKHWDKRPDGRPGWGLKTTSPLVNGGHRFVWVVYGLTYGLAMTLFAYAFAWMSQRPGKGIALAALAAFVKINISTWLG